MRKAHAGRERRFHICREPARRLILRGHEWSAPLRELLSAASLPSVDRLAVTRRLNLVAANLLWLDLLDLLGLDRLDLDLGLDWVVTIIG